MPNTDFKRETIREAAILTGSYVAADIIKDAERANQLVLNCFYTKGSLTSVSLKIEFASELLYTLGYDNQTTNFDTTKIVRGRDSRAVGKIVTDTDGGASGTLLLSNVRGTFLDDEPLEQEDGVTIALANGTLTEASKWVRHTASSISGGTDTLSVLTHTTTDDDNFQVLAPIKDKFIKVSAIGNGTLTGSSLEIEAVTGWV